LKISIKTRNRTIYILTFIALLLALASLPYEPFPNLFTPRVTATYRFSFGLENENGLRNVIGIGYVTLLGKGGLSANSPLTLEVGIVRFNESKITEYSGSPLKTIKFEPNNAYKYPIQKDVVGLPKFSAVNLTKSGDKWIGEEKVTFIREGEWGGGIYVNNKLFTMENVIHIGSEEIGVSATTNALIITLTWVFFSFALIELRAEEQRNKGKQQS